LAKAAILACSQSLAWLKPGKSMTSSCIFCPWTSSQDCQHLCLVLLSLKRSRPEAAIEVPSEVVQKLASFLQPGALLVLARLTELHFHDAESLKEVYGCMPFEDSIKHLACAPCGTRIAATLQRDCNSDAVIIIDLETRTVLQSIRSTVLLERARGGTGQIDSLAFGDCVAVGVRDKYGLREVHLLDPNSGSVVKTFQHKSESPCDLPLALITRHCAAIGREQIDFIDPVAGSLLQNLQLEERVHVWAYAPDGASLATGGLSGKTYLFDLLTGLQLQTWQFDNSACDLAYAPSCEHLVASLLDRCYLEVCLLDLCNGAVLQSWVCEDSVSQITFAPNSSYCVGADWDTGLHIVGADWDTGLHTFLVKKVAVNSPSLQSGLSNLWNQYRMSRVDCLAFAPLAT